MERNQASEMRFPASSERRTRTAVQAASKLRAQSISVCRLGEQARALLLAGRECLLQTQPPCFERRSSASRGTYIGSAIASATVVNGFGICVRSQLFIVQLDAASE